MACHGTENAAPRRRATVELRVSTRLLSTDRNTPFPRKQWHLVCPLRKSALYKKCLAIIFQYDLHTSLL